MNILMTGITGYLGSAIAHRLVEDPQVRLLAVKRSTSDVRRIADIVRLVKCYDVDRVPVGTPFELERVDVVIHCATNYGRNHELPADIVESNIVFPLKLLEASVVNGVKAFINTDTLLEKSVSDYALSKKQFNDWLRVYGGKLLAVNVAVEHFFGPGDSSTKFVSFVIKELLRGAGRIPLTAGEQRRDFVYITDVVAAFECVVRYVNERARTTKGYESFEVGRGESLTVKDFLLLMREVTGNMETVLDFGALPYRPNEAMCITADISRMKSLGWVPRMDLGDALRETIAEDRKLLCRLT